MRVPRPAASTIAARGARSVTVVALSYSRRGRMARSEPGLPTPRVLRENETHHVGGACRGGGDDDDVADRGMRGTEEAPAGADRRGRGPARLGCQRAPRHRA